MIISKISLHKQGRKLFLSHDRIIFEINSIYYYIISKQKEGLNADNSFKQLGIEFGYSSDYLKLIKEEYLEFIQKIKTKSKNSHAGYIKFKVVVLSEKINNKISSIFSVFFGKYFFLIISLISIGLNGYFWKNTKVSFTDSFMLIDTLYYILFFIVCLLFHEIGHSSALKHYGQKPSEVGFGIYFIFPVLYSDVSTTWLLSKTQKIIVNVGGIYFQLLINTLLILLIYLPIEFGFRIELILQRLILANISLVLFTLFPFFRNDGYWIYADIFGIQNLLQKADNSIKEIRKYGIKQNIPLIIFSVCNWIFRLYFIYYLVVLAVDNTGKIIKMSYNLELVKPTIMILFSAIGIIMMSKSIIKILISKTLVNESY